MIPGTCLATGLVCRDFILHKAFGSAFPGKVREAPADEGRGLGLLLLQFCTVQIEGSHLPGQ